MHGANPPPVDPDAASRKIGRGFRGRRFQMLVLGVLPLGIAGAVMLQKSLFHWGGSSVEETAITPAHAEMPAYRVVDPEPPPAPPVPGTAPPPPPLAKTAPPQRQAVANARSREPLQIAFDIKASGKEPDMSWYTDGTRPHLADGCALRPGASVISAVLDTVIKSEVSGPVIATVSEDVHSVDAGHYDEVIVPAGTKLFGNYNSERLDFQSRRMGMVWTEATLPDGTQISLADAAGMDVAGSNGVGGTVTTHWGQVIAVAALFTIFDAGQRGAVANENAYIDALQQSASYNASRVGKTVVERMLDWKPSIEIPAGTQVKVAVGKTVRVC